MTQPDRPARFRPLLLRGSPLALAALLLCGCANTGANYRPMVDFRPAVNMQGAGLSPEVYETDLAECQQYAARVPDAAQGAVVGALLGALLGAAIGRAAGSEFVGYGARFGAVSGGLGGAAGGESNQRAIIVRCMSGRGWSVLN